MKNKYEIRGDVTAILIESQKHGKVEALISTSELERVDEYFGSWYVTKYLSVQSLYVTGNLRRENGKRNHISLHRWITNAPSGMDVDHINHDTLDNTNSNLRVITRFENSQNRKGAQSDNKTGIRGVSWNKKVQKWHTYIYIKNVQKHIGYFKELDEAKLASIEARKKYMPFSQEYSGK